MAITIFTGTVGKLFDEGVLVIAQSNTAIGNLWSPVKLVSGDTDTAHLKVDDTNVAEDKIFGVFVAPNKTINAGDIVSVLVYGRTKLIVDSAVNVGDSLVTTNAFGKVKSAPQQTINSTFDKSEFVTIFDRLASIFAIAMTSASADGDEIEAFVITNPYKKGLTA